MWICPKCQNQIEDDTFLTCWNCLYERIPDSVVLTESKPTKPPPEVTCLRCQRPMALMGKALLNFGAFFISQKRLLAYLCDRCGKVDFFDPNIGSELRPPED